MFMNARRHQTSVRMEVCASIWLEATCVDVTMDGPGLHVKMVNLFVRSYKVPLFLKPCKSLFGVYEYLAWVGILFPSFFNWCRM